MHLSQSCLGHTSRTSQATCVKSVSRGNCPSMTTPAQPLPRVLDVRTFVEARAPELSALLSGIQTVHGTHKLGAAALPRHLRRRATSHQRRVHVRRKNVHLAGLSKRLKLADDAAPQLGGPSTSLRLTNRRMRRRPAVMCQAAAHVLCEQLSLPDLDAATRLQQEQDTAQPATSSHDPGTSTAVPGPASRQLETHAWHARRMRMHAPLWGHSLAMHAPGKGHGSRSFLHHVASNSVMHDASYWGCIQLSGHQEHIVKVLEQCSDQAYLAEQMSRSEVMCGAVEWPLQLHQCGTHPAGLLAPVKVIWIPCDAREADATQVAGQQLQEDESDWYAQCLCWVWIHPAAFRDCTAALQQAQARLESQGWVVQLTNLSRHLKRIEVVGGAADAAVHQAVQAQQPPSPRPMQAGSTGNAVWQSVGRVAVVQSQSVPRQRRSRHQPPPTSAAQAAQPASAPSSSQPPLRVRPPGEHKWEWPTGCVVGVTAADPRLAQATASGWPTPSTGSAVDQGRYNEPELQSLLASWPESGDWTDGAGPLLRMCTPMQQVGTHSRPPPAPAPAHLPPPASTNEVGLIRQQARRIALHLSNSSSPLEDTARAAQRTCPVLLIRQGYGAVSGWSVVLPAGWVQPVWIALSFTGARPAGQQEWRWVMSQAGAPCFPWDYPHTAAWHSTSSHIAQVQAAWALRRPPGRLPRPACQLPYIPWRLMGRPAEDSHVTHTWSHESMGLKPRQAQAAQQQGQRWSNHPVPASQADFGQADQLAGCGHVQPALQPGSSSMLSEWKHIQLCRPTLITSMQIMAVPGMQQLAWASVRILGKGRCLEGAQLCWASSALECAASSGQASLPSALSAGGVDGDGQLMVVVGHVTTACPRGTKPCQQRPSYPGGLGMVCLSSFLHVLSTQSRGSRTAGVLGPDVRQPVKLLLRNPGCNFVHRAQVLILLPAAG